MFDITQKRALDTGTIYLVEGDGSPLLDDAGDRLSVTVYGPGSKQWQQAEAESNRRRAIKLQNAGKNKIAAALEDAVEDQARFLTEITISFNGWEFPCPDGKWKSDKEMFRAAYSDDALGFIRSHVHREANDWTVFTKGSATS